MPHLRIFGDIVHQPIVAVGGMLACALAAKSGWLSLSFAYFGCVLALTLTQALGASVTRMRAHAEAARHQSKA